MGRRAEIALGVIVSILLHVGLVVFAPRAERDDEPARRKPPHKAMPVEVRREKAKLLSDLQKKADEVVADLVKAEPQKPVPTPEPPKAEPPKPKKKQPPKPAALPPKEPPKAEAPPTPAAVAPGGPPRPFVLSNVSLSGGVAVQTGGESNLFGDPSVDARGWKKKGSDAPAGPSSDGGVAQAPERRVVVVPPKPLNDVKGRYPEAHRDENRIVRVELLLQVDVQGAVVGAKVLKGDKPAFDEESKRTVQQLRFSPATRDGAPIAYELKWTVVFIPESG